MERPTVRAMTVEDQWNIERGTCHYIREIERRAKYDIDRAIINILEKYQEELDKIRLNN